MQYALITGWSRGIWLELAKLHAQAGHGLVLVARNQQELTNAQTILKAIADVPVHVFSQDLSVPWAAQAVVDFCAASELQIEYLVNNAWFGWKGNFWEQDLTRHQQMIQTNLTALTELTYLILPQMIKRKSGRVLHVWSTAGMVPGPTQAIYHATKAYVNSLSQAIAWELKGTGVTMTVLCPGPVDTWFFETANIVSTQINKQAVSADGVAQDGYDAMMDGELLVVSWLPAYYKILMNLMPLLPRSFILQQAYKAINE
jgi:uncharacterized protein